ncbi:hypothetical protein [Nonomuraea recticatena]|uniref:hypothetical protein n=1 Tax=Nonomuraea recticatena TaxID=46178 RepID=UPI00360DF2BC
MLRNSPRMKITALSSSAVPSETSTVSGTKIAAYTRVTRRLAQKFGSFHSRT